MRVERYLTELFPGIVVDILPTNTKDSGEHFEDLNDYSVNDLSNFERFSSKFHVVIDGYILNMQKASKQIIEKILDDEQLVDELKSFLNVTDDELFKAQLQKEFMINGCPTIQYIIPLDLLEEWYRLSQKYGEHKEQIKYLDISKVKSEMYFEIDDVYSSNLTKKILQMIALDGLDELQEILEEETDLTMAELEDVFGLEILVSYEQTKDFA